MASPFKIFRKNQKAALAVLTVVAMGGFVVLPTVVQMMGNGGDRAAASRPVATTTRYGDLDAMAMTGLRSDRQAVRAFLNQVEMLVRTNQQNWRTQTAAGQFQQVWPQDDESIIQTWLLVNHAQELGVVVDDAAVLEFLEEVTEGSVTNADLIGTGGEDRGLLGRLELPENQLFRLLKYELTAWRLRRLVATGLQPMTPGERWDYYQRLQRKMSVEFTEVAVDRFVNSVSDPDEATLQKFFDKYKEKEDVPESPEPGFRIPKRIAVEYFKVDYDHLFDPGELEKYYEEHKEEFKRESLPEVEPMDPAAELKGSLPGLDDPQFDLPPADGAAAEMAETPKDEPEAEKPEAEKPEAAAKPEEAAKKSEEAAKKPEEAAEPKAEEKSDQAKPEEPKQGASEKKADIPTPADESRTHRRSLFQLTAYQAEEEPAEEKKAEEKPAEEKKAEEKPAEEKKAEEKPAEEKKAEEKPAEEKKAEEKKAEEKPAEEKKAEEKPAEEKKAEEKPAEEKKAEEKPAEEKKAEEKPAEEKKAEEKPAEEKKADPKAEEAAGALDAISEDMPKLEPPSEYYSFEEVKSQIQSRLAPDKIERVFRPLENQMTIFHDANIRFIRTQDEEGNSTVAEPVKPDFAKLAAEAGIEAKVTELFSQREAFDRQLDISRSRVTVGDRPAEFLTYAFDSLSELRPARSQDTEGNYYLFWKTQDESDVVPELDDDGVRSRVVGAWKMMQARDAAQTEADRLASEARAKQAAAKEPISMATALAAEQGVTVQSTEPFTWFDPISIQLTMMGYGQPRLSTVELVAPEPKEGEEPPEAETLPMVGADFMRTVAGLDKGGVGVAWNQPETVAYVVRMDDTTPEAKELRSLFFASADERQLQMVAQDDKVHAFREWVESLEKAVGFEMQQ